MGLSKGGLEGVDPLGSLGSLDLSIDDDLNDLGTNFGGFMQQALLLCLEAHRNFCKIMRTCEEPAGLVDLSKTSLEGVQVFEEVHDVFGGVPVVVHVSYLITSELNFTLGPKYFT